MARISCALSIGAILVACGQVAPLPEDAGPPETFAHSFARTVCDALKDCCAKDNLPYDRASCITIIEGYVQHDVVIAREANRAFHPDVASTCLKNADVRAHTCDLTAFRSYGYGTPAFDWASCFGLYSDALPQGSPCEQGGQCASGRCTGWPNVNTECARLVPQAGDSCARTADCQSFDEAVSTNLHCDVMSHVCVEPADGKCGVSEDCGWSGPACCSQGKCVRDDSVLIGEGCSCPSAPCGDRGVCSYDICVRPPRGGVCDLRGFCGLGDVCDETDHCVSHLTTFCKTSP